MCNQTVLPAARVPCLRLLFWQAWGGEGEMRFVGAGEGGGGGALALLAGVGAGGGHSNNCCSIAHCLKSLQLGFSCNKFGFMQTATCQRATSSHIPLQSPTG